LRLRRCPFQRQSWLQIRKPSPPDEVADAKGAELRSILP
jgi:hypothetical protein